MSKFSLKELQTRKAKLNASLKSKKMDLKDIQKEVKDANEKIAEVNRKIKQATINPTVSEHAVLRYLERKLGIDIEEIKEEIMSDKLEELIRQFRSGKFPIGFS